MGEKGKVYSNLQRLSPGKARRVTRKIYKIKRELEKAFELINRLREPRV